MIRVLAFLVTLFASSAVFAQTGVTPYCPTGLAPPNQLAPCSSIYPLPVSGSFSASLGGFTPSAAGARGTPLSVTTSDSSGNLPTGAVVAVTNVGANPMYCNVNGVAATTSDQYISSAGGWFAFTIPAAVTTLHCIATGGSTTANTVGGSGLPTGTGGGGGSSGGAVTLASGAVASGAYAAGSLAAGAGVDGWDLTQGTKGDTLATNSTSSWSVIALLKGIYAQLVLAVSGINSAIAAGANVIGGVFGSPNVTQTDCSIALTTGGTAQNIISAGASLHGFRIMNIDTTAGSGEPIWISFTTTAAASTIASYPLAAPTATTFAGAGSYSAEFASGTNGNVSVVAATSGHKISCTKW